MVEDIDSAIHRWQREFGIGPFLVARDARPLVNAFYRGEKSQTLILDLAFAYQGNLQIELIALKKRVPSMYQEVLERGQRDLQHYAVRVADFDKACDFVASQGFQTLMTSGIKGLARMHYVEAVDFSKNVFAPDQRSYMKTPEGFGIVLEIIEDNELTRPYFEKIEQAVAAIPRDQQSQDFDLAGLVPAGVVLRSLGRMLLSKLTGS